MSDIEKPEDLTFIEYKTIGILKVLDGVPHAIIDDILINVKAQISYSPADLKSILNDFKSQHLTI